MAVGPDGVNFLHQVMTRDLEIVQDVLTVFGAYYIGTRVVSVCCDLYVGFRNFVWARLYPVDYVKKYGPWAVVTGATDGLGKEYARELARRGMKVVLISGNEEELQRVAGEITKETGAEVTYVAADFTLGREVFPKIGRAIGNLDVGILVNNVGLFTTRSFGETDEKECWDVLEVNNNALVAMTRLVLPGMAARKRGAVVNLTSAAGCRPAPLTPLYSSTKAFNHTFSRCLSYECARSGVTVQSVFPFHVRTPVAEDVASRFRGLKRVLHPDASTFARSAVATIPYAGCTTGYWLHALHLRFLSLFGEYMWARSSRFLSALDLVEKSKVH